jgi:hypothetical protein
MFVVRINAGGEMVNAKPCAMCIFLMLKFNVRTVYYSDDNGDIVKEKVSAMATYFSRGLITMVKRSPSPSTLKLPLSKDDRRRLFVISKEEDGIT